MIVIPAFRAGAAILSSKIDEMVRAFLEVANGGISREQLAPGTVFAAADFAARYSLAQQRHLAVATPTPQAPIPYASRLVSLQCRIRNFTVWEPITITVTLWEPGQAGRVIETRYLAERTRFVQLDLGREPAALNSYITIATGPRVDYGVDAGRLDLEIAHQ